MSKVNRTARPLAIHTLLVALAAGGAANAAAFPAAPYREIVRALDEASAQRASDPTRSLAAIDRARETFEGVAPTLGKSVLTEGIGTALQNTRIAVARSQTDLDAQAALARGLLRKALHDTTLTALSKKEAGVLVEIGALADDFGFRGSPRASIVSAARAGQVDLVRLEFEKLATDKLDAALTRANTNDRAVAYLETARAMSWFGIVQDSPRVGALTTRDFVDAIESLTKNDLAGFTARRAELRAAGTRFRQASAEELRRVRAGAPVSSAPAQPDASAPSGPAVTPVPADTTNSTRAPGRPDASLEGLYAPLGRALIASSQGDGAAVRLALADAGSLISKLPDTVRDSTEVDRLRMAVERTSNTSAVRPVDVRALMGLLAGAEAAQLGNAPGALESVGAAVNAPISGVPRALLTLLLGVFAIYPLYLLNLAFGGRNPYWRAISVAFVLLLLPVMTEGLASLGVLLADVTGVSALGAFASVSLMQGGLGGVAWLLTLLAGLSLATWGFRGICTQFGLLGRGRAPAEAQVQKAAVEWDDEL